MVKTNESNGKNIQLDIISLCFHDVEALSILVKYLVVHKINMTLKMSHHKKNNTVPYHQQQKHQHSSSAAKSFSS